MSEENNQILKRMEEESQQKDKNLEQLLLFILMHKGTKELQGGKEEMLSIMPSENQE